MGIDMLEEFPAAPESPSSQSRGRSNSRQRSGRDRGRSLLHDRRSRASLGASALTRREGWLQAKRVSSSDSRGKSFKRLYYFMDIQNFILQEFKKPEAVFKKKPRHQWLFRDMESIELVELLKKREFKMTLKSNAQHQHNMLFQVRDFSTRMYFVCVEVCVI